jgi:hypothetical protein
MRYVIIPETITAQSKGVKFTLSFGQCLEMWLDDKRFGRSQQAMRFAARIDRKFIELGSSPVGGVLELEDTEWSLLADVVREREPGSEYNAATMRHAIAMLDAVTEASDKKPARALDASAS